MLLSMISNSAMKFTCVSMSLLLFLFFCATLAVSSTAEEVSWEYVSLISAKIYGNGGMILDVPSQTIYLTGGNSLYSFPTSVFSNQSALSTLMSQTPQLNIIPDQLVYDRNKAVFYITAANASLNEIQLWELDATVFSNATVLTLLPPLPNVPAQSIVKGMFLDQTGHTIWMADEVNNNIFGYDINFHDGFAVYGVGKLNSPYDVYRDSIEMGGALWVTDSRNSRIVRIDMNGNVFAFGNASQSYFTSPAYLTRDMNGTVWVTTSNGLISFSPNNFQATYTQYYVPGERFTPFGVAVDSTSNATYSYVYVLNAIDGGVFDMWRMQVNKAALIPPPSPSPSPTKSAALSHTSTAISTAALTTIIAVIAALQLILL